MTVPLSGGLSPIGLAASSLKDRPPGDDVVSHRTAPALPDGLTLSVTWVSASVVDLLLASSVVTTRWISLAWLAVATDARTAIKLNVLNSMAPVAFFVAARSPPWADRRGGSVAI